MQMEFIKMGINGEGIGYLDQKPVFCPGVLPGETAEVRITEKNRSFFRAECVRLTGKSEHRIQPASKEEYESGSAPLMILKYEQQLAYKKQLLEEALWKYGHVNRKLIRDMRPSPLASGYRSECKLPVGEEDGKLVMGLYKAGSNQLIPVKRFVSHTAELEEKRLQALKILQASKLRAYDKKTGHGLRWFVMRVIGGRAQLTLVTGKDQISPAVTDSLMKIEGMTGVFQSINDRKKPEGIFGATKLLAGEETMEIEIHGLKLQLSPQSFFQLNVPQAEALYAMAVDKLDECDHLFEGYCGVGAMSMMARNKARRITGAENVKQAIRNAQAAAEANRVPNVSFVCADSAEAFISARKKLDIDAVIADPPRSGMDDEMINALLKSSVRKIIYISCNPATLGKNLKELKKSYDIRTVIPYDMFPGTPHVEALCVLERTGGK